MDPVFHLRCVSLLYQLHNLVPNPKAIERILARSLERENDGCTGSNVVDSYQRFSTLWHLSRDLDVKTGGGSRRNFDICLLKMLDNLNLSTGPLRALSQSWLVHAMARGDIARLMEPLFITLLDPSTARQVKRLPASCLRVAYVDYSCTRSVAAAGCIAFSRVVPLPG